MRVYKRPLKGYTGRYGGHFVLMVNGFLTLVVNWILLVIVLVPFTPAVYFYEMDQEILFFLVLCYLTVLCHFVVVTVMVYSMLIRSLVCPYRGMIRS